MEAQNKHPELKSTLKAFAKLVAEKMPQAAYFVACYLDDRVHFSPWNASFDMQPRVFIDDQDRLLARMPTFYAEVAGLHYFLGQGNVEQLESYLGKLGWKRGGWLHALRIFNEADPALLHAFFSTVFGLGCGDEKLFELTAPVALGMDPMLSNALIAIAGRNRWAEPVAEACNQQEKIPYDCSAGDVHMQPLIPVASTVDGIWANMDFAINSSGKMAKRRDGMVLYINADNVLNIISRVQYYLHVRSFASGKVSTCEFDTELVGKIKVQHGDVIVLDANEEHPLFLEAQIHCTDLSAEGRFECVKSFAYSARNRFVLFLAIVQRDALAGLAGPEIKAADSDGRESSETNTDAQNELQES